MAAPGKHPEMRVWQERPLNAETPPHLLAGAATTPVECFFVRSHGPLPEGSGSPSLVVDGLVGRPLELRLAELPARFDARTLTATLACAGNRRSELAALRAIPGQIPWGAGAIGTAVWSGAPLAAVLREAGVRAGARHVAFLGRDEARGCAFGGSIPLAKALSGEVLLAWAMNGRELPREHGGPLRALVPGYVGARSVKWLARVTVQREESRNPFQRDDYRLVPAGREPGPGVGVALGELPLNAGILAPAEGATVPAGPLAVEGWALSGGGRAIERVEVSVDGGRAWSQAELLEDRGPWAWRLWRARLALSPGPAEIAARAWDSSGTPQPSDPAPLWNPRGYANAAWPRARVVARA